MKTGKVRYILQYNSGINIQYIIIVKAGGGKVRYMLQQLMNRVWVNGAPRVWAEKIYFGHKILMKQPHDCSY